MPTELETNKVYLGNTLEVLKAFPSDSIDCVVTSPPYYMMRRYEGIPDYIWDGDANCEHDWHLIEKKPGGGSGRNAIVGANRNDKANMRDVSIYSNTCTKCGAWRGQLGNEPTYTMFLDHLIQITAELKRVLKPSGTMFINLGDTYSGSNNGKNDRRDDRSTRDKAKYDFSCVKVTSVPRKSTMLIPSRYAIRCMDELNLIVRNDIIWFKKNPMCESVKDRYSKMHEHIIFMTKSDKYYFDLDAVREPYADASYKRYEYGRKANKYEERGVKVAANATFVKKAIETGKPLKDIIPMNPLGKNPGDVWHISTKPSSAKHYATYNSELITKPILSGCPIGGIVLDPFVGSGTTLITAIDLDRQAIGIEGSETYLEIAEETLYKKLSQQKIEWVA